MFGLTRSVLFFPVKKGFVCAKTQESEKWFLCSCKLCIVNVNEHMKSTAGACKKCRTSIPGSWAKQTHFTGNCTC